MFCYPIFGDFRILVIYPINDKILLSKLIRMFSVPESNAGSVIPARAGEKVQKEFFASQIG
jgi:hypothetical protein